MIPGRCLTGAIEQTFDKVTAFPAVTMAWRSCCQEHGCGSRRRWVEEVTGAGWCDRSGVIGLARSAGAAGGVAGGQYGEWGGGGRPACSGDGKGAARPARAGRIAARRWAATRWHGRGARLSFVITGPACRSHLAGFLGGCGGCTRARRCGGARARGRGGPSRAGQPAGNGVRRGHGRSAGRDGPGGRGRRGRWRPRCRSIPFPATGAPLVGTGPQSGCGPAVAGTLAGGRGGTDLRGGRLAGTDGVGKGVPEGRRVDRAHRRPRRRRPPRTRKRAPTAGTTRHRLNHCGCACRSKPAPDAQCPGMALD